ncbi:hypothetical protein FOZ63_025969, partial [Perkinsus olseni]
MATPSSSLIPDHRLPRTASDLSGAVDSTITNVPAVGPTPDDDDAVAVPPRSSRRATVFAAKIFPSGSSMAVDHSLAVDKRESMALELSASGSLEPQKVLVLENICKELKQRAMVVGDSNRKMDLIRRATT